MIKHILICKLYPYKFFTLRKLLKAWKLLHVQLNADKQGGLALLSMDNSFNDMPTDLVSLKHFCFNVWMLRPPYHAACNPMLIILLMLLNIHADGEMECFNWTGLHGRYFHLMCLWEILSLWHLKGRMIMILKVSMYPFLPPLLKKIKNKYS